MKRLILAAALLLVSVGAARAAKPAKKEKTPAQAISALLSFKAPNGWKTVEYANAGAADPVLRFERGSDAILIRAYGAPGTDFPTPGDLIDGAVYGTAPLVVAGNKVELRRRRFPIKPADSHHPSSANELLGVEEFCILPLKEGRFAVLAYRRESPIPDIERKGEKAWASFLKTVRVKK